MPLPLPVLIRGHRGPLPSPTTEQRALADQLRRDVTILALDIGPRHTGLPARLDLAADFLESALVAAGLRVTRQRFDTFGVTCSNLIATPADRDDRQPCLVLGAHYDSVINCPAANDNGSGVAGVLALARRWAAAGPPPGKLGIRFVLFANEEPPHFHQPTMGSLVYAQSCRERGDDLRGMICLETIGCYKHEPGSQTWPNELPGVVRRMLPDAGNFILWAGNWASRGFIRRCGEVFARQAKFPLLATAVPDALGEIGWSDHWSFNQCGYEAVMVTDTAPFRYHHYHRSTDTPDKLDFDSMARVVDGVGIVIDSLIR